MIVVADASPLVALSTCNCLPLLDNRRAKRVAYSNGLEVMGSVGVLLLAKQRGLLAHVKPMLDMLAVSDIHLGENIILRALRQAGGGMRGNGETAEENRTFVHTPLR